MNRRAYEFAVAKNVGNLTISHEITEDGGITYIQIHVESGGKQIFQPVACTVTVPSCEVHEIWNPKIHLIKALNQDWFEYLKKTNGFTGAPVQALIGMNNQNCAALGLSDTLNTFGFQVVPVEETGEYAFTVEMFGEEHTARSSYDVTLRLDQREIPYYDVLRGMALWWEEDGRNRPAFVPRPAREPMYSTWYSYHQMIGEEALLTQCRLCQELGCKAILLDDGWQTDDSSRGYAYCGDWEPAPSKIPDMAAFVKKVHSLGMKVIPWYSLPFIGEKSKNFQRFADMLIDPDADREWHVLDPRYPQVREFIISLFENALLDWDVDGFKMDFVDEFVVTPFSGRETDERRDTVSFHDAADQLMTDCIARLKERKPDILLEFRQTYNGPLMRSYGNIFRAVDCPFDAVENHVRVTDIRLLCGDSAVHSDMIMWHPQDTAESAALQIINILFSVPQISMRLNELPEDHRRMLRFYCGLWKKYRDAFIGGTFQPLNPIARYNVVQGSFKEQFVCTWHTREVILMETLYDDMVFVNGSAGDKLYLEYRGADQRERMAGKTGAVGDINPKYLATVYDCCGEVKREAEIEIKPGVHVIDVTPSGTVVMTRL